jgi:hypothetical protein
LSRRRAGSWRASSAGTAGRRPANGRLVAPPTQSAVFPSTGALVPYRPALRHPTLSLRIGPWGKPMNRFGRLALVAGAAFALHACATYSPATFSKSGGSAAAHASDSKQCTVVAEKEAKSKAEWVKEQQGLAVLGGGLAAWRLSAATIRTASRHRLTACAWRNAATAQTVLLGGVRRISPLLPTASGRAALLREGYCAAHGGAANAPLFGVATDLPSTAAA